MAGGIDSKILFQTGTLADQGSKKIYEFTKRCSLNHCVEVVTTACRQSQLTRALMEVSPPLYLTAWLPVSTFIRPQVIQQAVRDGSLVALCIRRLIDRDSTAAVLPNGILKLVLQKEAYERMGLIGKPACFSKNVFVVDIDLLAPTFLPGKPNYERVKRALELHLPLSMNFALTVDPAKDVAVLGRLLEATVSVCQPTDHELTNILIPRFSPSEDLSCTPLSFYTWLGALSSDVGLEPGSVSSYESCFATPEPDKHVQRVFRRRWTGMIHPHWFQSLLNSLQDAMSQCNSCGEYGFLAVHVHGFEDAPVTQDKVEHSYFLHGENVHTVVMTASREFHLYRSLSSWDYSQ